MTKTHHAIVPALFLDLVTGGLSLDMEFGPSPFASCLEVQELDY